MGKLLRLYEPENAPRFKPFPLAVMICALTVFAAYPGSGFSAPLAIAVAVFALITLFCFAKSLLGFAVVLVPTVVVWFYTGSFAVAAFVCSLILSVALAAFLQKCLPTRYLPLIIPAIYGIALLCSRSFLISALSLVFLPASVVLAMSLSGRISRIAAVCRTAVALALTGAVCLAVYIAITAGSLTPDAITDAANAAFNRMIDYYTQKYAELAVRYEARGIDSSTLALTPADAKLYAVAVYGLLPAFVIAAINLLAFASHQIAVSLCKTADRNEALTPKALSFSMSWVSVLVYIVAYFTMHISSYSGNDTVSLIAENIYLILLPGLVLTGVLVMLGKGVSGKRHLVLLAGVVLLLFVSPNVSLVVSAFIGCATIIRINLRRILPPRDSE